MFDIGFDTEHLPFRRHRHDGPDTDQTGLTGQPLTGHKISGRQPVVNAGTGAASISVPVSRRSFGTSSATRLTVISTRQPSPGFSGGACRACSTHAGTAMPSSSRSRRT